MYIATCSRRPAMADATLSKESSSCKKRRSWFEQGRNIRFDIAMERSIDEIAGVDHDIETLLLTPFSKPPIVDFGKVNVGLTKSCKLRVRNPHGYRQQVIIVINSNSKRSECPKCNKHYTGTLLKVGTN